MADENANPQNVSNLYVASELPEILAAAAIAFSLIPVNKDRLAGVLIAVLLMLLSIALKLVAGTRERDALETRVYHVITAHRLKTLETVGAGTDVIEVLKLQLDQRPMTTEELVSWLEEKLGHERVQEKIDIIRRYTRVPNAALNGAGAQIDRFAP